MQHLVRPQLRQLEEVVRPMWRSPKSFRPIY
nr:MAG TPA: hypothetical protein [Caudoviricetes sp.]